MCDQPNIDVRQAFKNASSFITDLMNEQGEPAIDPRRITLEEFGLSKDAKFWLVTLGYPAPEIVVPVRQEGEESAGGRFVNQLPLKRYRRFKVDAEDGRVVSMKAR